MTKAELEEMNELRAKYQALYEVHKETILELRKAKNDLSFYKELTKEYECWRINLLNDKHYEKIQELWDYRSKNNKEEE